MKRLYTHGGIQFFSQVASVVINSPKGWEYEKEEENESSRKESKDMPNISKELC